jgi:hypothetical protein
VHLSGATVVVVVVVVVETGATAQAAEKAIQTATKVSRTEQCFRIIEHPRHQMAEFCHKSRLTVFTNIVEEIFQVKKRGKDSDKGDAFTECLASVSVN